MVRMLVVLEKTNYDGVRQKQRGLGLDIIDYRNICHHIQYFTQYQI